MLGSTTRLSKTTLYRFVSSTVSNVLVFAFDLVWIVDSHLPRVFFGFGDFVDDVLFEEVKV